MLCTETGIAYDREGPPGSPVVLLLHAGVADRRMWDAQWPTLTRAYDVLRVDLRGFGESTTPPQEQLVHHRDVADTLAARGIDAVHVLACSLGAGVAVEVALAEPSLVRSLHLAAPGGCLIADWTPHLRAFADAERAALAAGDLDAAVAANLDWWVAGPHRGDGPAAVRDRVALLQRRAFEVTADWEVQEGELEPPALTRLGDLTVPVSVLDGALDLDAIRIVAATLAREVPGAVHEVWDDVAHLPSLEQPARYADAVLEWLGGQ